MFKEYYKLNLPYPPETVGEFEKEVFMTLNFLRVKPKFFINNFMETMLFRNQKKLSASERFTMDDIEKCIATISKFEPGKLKI